ncbi:hypothetical protein BH11ACT8_BH11ACT8_04540 [soil metagenome]
MNLAHRIGAAAAVATLSLASFTACSGSDGNATNGGGGDSATPQEVLDAAKAKLDETSGVRLSLSTDDTLDVAAFLKSADGVVTTAPAFEGKASGSLSGIPASDVPIISVDGKLYANVLGGWRDFDPTTLCAPDPALLLDPEKGISPVLGTAEDITAGTSQRAEDDNTVIVTPYTATVPGAAIKNILPCAPGYSFDARFTIADDGSLRSAVLTGQFFEGGDDITYTITVDDYDVNQEITAP